MSAERPYPVGARLRCLSPNPPSEYATVFFSPRFGYGVRFEEYDYGDEDDPEDQHDFWDFTWEPVDPKDRPVKGICKFLRKFEEKT